MLRFALIALTAALALGGTDALADKDKKDALKEAKENAKEKAKEAKEKAKEKAKDRKEAAKDAAKDAKDDGKGKDGEHQHGKAGEDHGKGKDGEHGKDGGEHGKRDGDKPAVDKDGRGKALTLDDENAKHARRLEKIAAVEAKAKTANKPELLERVAAMREKETRRHAKALARINGTKTDSKTDDNKDDGKKDGAK